MNREQRRKSAKNKNAGKQALEAIKKQQEIALWVDSAANDTFLMAAFVLHDKFGFGKARLERMRYEMARIVSAFRTKHLDLDDIEEAVKEICGGYFPMLTEEIDKERSAS